MVFGCCKKLPDKPIVERNIWFQADIGSPRPNEFDADPNMSPKVGIVFHFVDMKENWTSEKEQSEVNMTIKQVRSEMSNSYKADTQWAWNSGPDPFSDSTLEKLQKQASGDWYDLDDRSIPPPAGRVKFKPEYVLIILRESSGAIEGYTKEGIGSLMPVGYLFNSDDFFDGSVVEGELVQNACRILHPVQCTISENGDFQGFSYKEVYEYLEAR